MLRATASAPSRLLAVAAALAAHVAPSAAQLGESGMEDMVMQTCVWLDNETLPTTGCTGALAPDPTHCTRGKLGGRTSAHFSLHDARKHWSNLGGLGPDRVKVRETVKAGLPNACGKCLSAQQSMWFENVSPFNGGMLDLLIENTTEYGKGGYNNLEKNLNRLKPGRLNPDDHEFMQVNVAAGKMGPGETGKASWVRLKMTLLDHTTRMPVVVPQFFLAVYDLDQQRPGSGGKEGITVEGYHALYVANETVLKITHSDTPFVAPTTTAQTCLLHKRCEIDESYDWVTEFGLTSLGHHTHIESTSHGVYEDNPASHATLTKVQRQKSVMIEYRRTSSFEIIFSVGRGNREFSPPHGSHIHRVGARNFHFSGIALDWPVCPQVEGDPFAIFDGRKVQFWLEKGVLVPLLSSGGTTLLGEVMEVGAADAAEAARVGAARQQWFKRFAVTVAGRTVVNIARRDPTALLPATAAEEELGADAAGDADGVAVALSRANTAVRELLKGRQGGAAPPLTTLSVAVDGTGVAHAGGAPLAAGGSALNVSVSRTDHAIGSGVAEAVRIDAGFAGFVIAAAAANKFATPAARVRHLHLDLSFTHVNASQCTGLLPEIWGVRPMSDATAKMLSPR